MSQTEKEISRGMEEKTKILYVFHGYASEYSLAPLAAYFKRKGEEILELDQFQDDTFFDKIKEIAEKKIIYITSWHLWFDSYNFEKVYNKMHTISPLEMMELLKPVFSVFYPHDLQCFLHDSEMRWADLFDLVLLPYKDNTYYYLQKMCRQVACVGWIKKDTNTGDVLGKGKYRPVYFPSNVPDSYSCLGKEGYINYLNQYFDKSIPLKFAPSIEYESIRNGLEMNGHILLETELSVYDILDRYNLIITNGNSSIVWEAALNGIPVISIMDGFLARKEYMESFKGCKGVYAMEIEELNGFMEYLAESDAVLAHGDNVLGKFEFEKAYQLITQ